MSRRGHGTEFPEPVKQAPMVAVSLTLSRPEEGWRATGPQQAEGSKRAWWRYSRVSDTDLAELERKFDLKGIILGGRIRDWAYPRAEEVNGRTAIFLQVPVEDKDPNHPYALLLTWQGLLLVDGAEGLITLSRTAVPFLDDVPRLAGENGLDIRASTVLHLTMVRALDLVEDYVQGAEVELSRVEMTPVSRQPRAFLAVTYGAKKEIDHTLAWLVHVRVIFKNLLDRKLVLAEWDKDDEDRTKLLLEKV